MKSIMVASELVDFVENTKAVRFRVLVDMFDSFADITKKELLNVLGSYLGPGASIRFHVDVDTAFDEVICRIWPET